MDDKDPFCRRLPSAERVVPEQAMRDLMGLLALPALWAGRDPTTILQLMIEAAERIVPLRFTYVKAYPYPEHPAIEVLRAGGEYALLTEQDNWGQFAQDWNKLSVPDGRASTCLTPFGSLQVIRLSLGFGTYGGKVWFGSDDAGFPGFTHLAFLKTAASLVTTSFQTARAAHEREQASRAKDEFLAMLGHELRNPLAPIVTALELFKLKNAEEVPQEVQVIDRQAKHLSRLVDDLLDVARITRGKVDLRKEPLDLGEVLAQACEGTHALFQQRRHTLSVDLPAEEVWVYGDRVRLIQVFSNLLTNAAKYTEPGGEIRMQLRVLQHVASVAVRDNGPGIPPELMPKLFNIFEQGLSSIDRRNGGLGIGLALVKNFVELHDGTVSVTSNGAAIGAEFTVTLPLHLAAKLVDPTIPLADAIGVCPMRILLVDDNVDALNGIAQYLTYRGHDVKATSDAHEGLAIAQQFRPDIALLDIGLPVLDGYALASALRSNPLTQAIRLIALTGYGQTNDIRKSRAAGFDVHLIKPVVLSDLDKAIGESV